MVRCMLPTVHNVPQVGMGSPLVFSMHALVPWPCHMVAQNSKS
jgi:hypothetical protein